mgnify:FL=1
MRSPFCGQQGDVARGAAHLSKVCRPPAGSSGRVKQNTCSFVLAHRRPPTDHLERCLDLHVGQKRDQKPTFYPPCEHWSDEAPIRGGSKKVVYLVKTVDNYSITTAMSRVSSCFLGFSTWALGGRYLGVVGVDAGHSPAATWSHSNSYPQGCG